MKTGGLKMLQKGPNFKNFPAQTRPFGPCCSLLPELFLIRGGNSLQNLRSPALLGVYPALVWREYFSQKKLATPSSVFRLDCLESQFKEIKICLQERKVVVVHEVALSPPPVVAASQSDATIHLVSLPLFYKSANKRTKSKEKNRHMTKLWYM